jgi:hydrogenase small subunit
MFHRTAEPWLPGETLGEHLDRRGVSRRDFLKFCGQMTVMLGLGQAMAPRVAEALQSVRKPSVLWASLMECTGCTESVLRTGDPSIGELIINLVSLDFQENLQAAAGHEAEAALQAAMKENYGKYLLVVTGSGSLAEDGVYCTIGGRTANDILIEMAGGASAILAVGACAHWGNIQASKPNIVQAVGVSDIIKDKPIVNIAGCPPVPETVTATVVHYLTFGRLPDTDGDGRPLFAYGARIHDMCPRRANFDAGQFVEVFDDEAARKGWCLYKVGCKGPATFSPCPIFLWNDRTSWPIGAGSPCIGCTERNFWDNNSPFYERMPNVAGFGIESTADTVGAALAAGAVAGVAAHALATGVHRYREQRRARELPVVNRPPEPPAGGSHGAH